MLTGNVKVQSLTYFLTETSFRLLIAVLLNFRYLIKIHMCIFIHILIIECVGWRSHSSLILSILQFFKPNHSMFCFNLHEFCVNQKRCPNKKIFISINLNFSVLQKNLLDWMPIKNRESMSLKTDVINENKIK